VILLQVENSLFLQNHEFLIVGNEGKRYYKKVQNIIRKAFNRLSSSTVLNDLKELLN